MSFDNFTLFIESTRPFFYNCHNLPNYPHNIQRIWTWKLAVFSNLMSAQRSEKKITTEFSVPIKNNKWKRLTLAGKHKGEGNLACLSVSSDWLHLQSTEWVGRAGKSANKLLCTKGVIYCTSSSSIARYVASLWHIFRWWRRNVQCLYTLLMMFLLHFWSFERREKKNTKFLLNH